MKIQKLKQFRNRRAAEKELNNDPQLVKVKDNKWRHKASGCYRWIDSQNWLVISYGK